jgi:amino acid adenylation domain-containing protein
MVLCALFAVTLSRWSGHSKVAFSTPVDTRTDPRWHRTGGIFVNSMPVLLDVGGNPAFIGLLGRARDAVLTALQYAYVPPAQIQAALAVGSAERDLLHQVTLTVEKADSPDFQMGTVRAVVRRLPPVHTAFGLSVSVELGRSSARVSLRYDEALYSAEQGRRFGDHFVETIAAAGMATREAELPRRPSSDRLRLREWGHGPTRKGIVCLTDRVARLVQEAPGLAAASEGNRVFSYRELWEESAKYAHRLRELGARTEDVVAICLPRSVNLLAAVLGTLRAGASFMPLDSRNPPLRNARQLADMGASVLIADDYSTGGGWNGPELSPRALAENPDTSFGDEPTHPDSLAYIIATSGSTGIPKGVMVSHRGLANYLQWATHEYGLGVGCRVPLHSSPAFDMAITSLLGPLYAGAEVHVLPERLGPSAVAKHFHDGYQVVKGTPSHLSAVPQPDAGDTNRPPSVVVFGGENFPAEQARQWAAQVPGSILVNEYGPTETVVGATTYTVTGPAASGFVPIGRPIANTWIQVVDADLQPVPGGVRGELVIGGSGVARGYYRAPALTAERFVPDPFGPETGGRLYRTGDIGFWNMEGQLELIGRSDDQVKILGYRVEPGEVEAALAHCPGIRQAAVVTDRREGVQLAAYVVPEQNGEAMAAPEQIRDYLRQVLPPHMIPGLIMIIEALPLGSSGKVDRRALPAPRQAPIQVKASAAAESGAEWRAVVREAWRAVLPHVPISDETSFFEVGGNSLMLLALLTELIERGTSGLSLTDLFRFPTIAGLANRIAATEANPGNRAGEE